MQQLSGPFLLMNSEAVWWKSVKIGTPSASSTLLETSQSTSRQEYAQREGAMQTIAVKMNFRGRDRPELVPLAAGVFQSHHRLHKEADDDSCLAPGFRKKPSFPAGPLELPQVTNLDIHSGTDTHPNNKCG